MHRMNHAQRQIDLRAQDPVVAPWIIRWLVSGPKPQPNAIFRRLILHSQTKSRTLVLAVAATTIEYSIAPFSSSMRTICATVERF